MKMDYEYDAGDTSSDEVDSAALPPLPPVTARKFVTVDIERYAALLDGSDMTEGEKIEFVTALWTMLISLGDMGYTLRERSGGSGDV